MAIVIWAVFILTTAAAIAYAVRPARWLRGLTTALLALGAILSLGSAGALVWDAGLTAHPADKATLVSLGLSEGLNCLAFWLIVMAPALVLVVVGGRRRRRMQATNT
jgi:hypothetical protein